MQRGRILGAVPKSYLPNYREFYEKRQFAAAAQAVSTTIRIAGQEVPFGSGLLFAARNLDGFVLHVEICEDLWVPLPPSTFAALAGATHDLPIHEVARRQPPPFAGAAGVVREDLIAEMEAEHGGERPPAAHYGEHLAVRAEHLQERAKIGRRVSRSPEVAHVLRIKGIEAAAVRVELALEPAGDRVTDHRPTLTR